MMSEINEDYRSARSTSVISPEVAAQLIKTSEKANPAITELTRVENERIMRELFTADKTYNDAPTSEGQK